MGVGRTGATTYSRVWDLYNINMQPPIDITTFFWMLVKEQDSSREYEIEEGARYGNYLYDLKSDGAKRLTDFMDANGQNVAILTQFDFPTYCFDIVYKSEGVWYLVSLYRTMDEEKRKELLRSIGYE